MHIDSKELIDPLLADIGLKPGTVVHARQQIRGKIYTGKNSIINNVSFHHYINDAIFHTFLVKKKQKLLFCGYKTDICGEFSIPTYPAGGLLTCLVFMPLGDTARTLSHLTDNRIYVEPDLAQRVIRDKCSKVIDCSDWIWEAFATDMYFGRYAVNTPENQINATRDVFLKEVLPCMFYVEKTKGVL